MGNVASEIQRKVKAQVDLPPGYFVEYGGQFGNQRRAMNRLYIVVPIMMAFSSVNVATNSRHLRKEDIQTN